MWKEAFVPKYSSIRTVMSVQYTRVTDRRRTYGQITTPYTALGQRRAVKAKFHDTGPTGPDRTRADPSGLFRETRAADPGLRQSSRTLSGRVRSGPCSGI